MDAQELQKLREQVTSSKLLTQIEKTEWIQLLSEMNETQASELRSILQSAESHAPHAAPTPVEHAGQKDLPGGIPLAALEKAAAEPLLSEHTTPVVAPTPTPVHPQNPIVHERPAWQKNIVDHTSPVDSQTPAPATPAHTQPIAHVVQPEAHVSAPTPVAAKASSLPTVHTPEDLEKVNLAFIRQGDPQLILNNLLHAVTEMTKKYTITQILGKIEQSPLYKIYYDTGLSALNSGALSAQQQPNAFSKEEFEAFADFRHAMEHILS